MQILMALGLIQVLVKFILMGALILGKGEIVMMICLQLAACTQKVVNMANVLPAGFEPAISTVRG